MQGKTHNKITRIIMPDLDPKKIERIDSIIDSAEPWMPKVAPEFGKVPGLSYRGHRNRGHDLLTASKIGFREGGPRGLAAALTHVALDAGRDQIVKKCGPNVADLVETVLNLGLDV